MNGPVTKAILHLRDLGEARLRDGELLGAFVARRDPAAFEALVRRHGPMVLGVCRRVLRDAHDAEDAFQAAFLVLARRAASVVPREMVGNYLYGVAYRTALEAKRMIARRRAKEKPADGVPHPTTTVETPGGDLAGVLDEELSRLPDKLRLPVVLCDLEGRTRREVARQLGIPEGTLSNRLALARRTLAKRLTGRGVTLGAAALAAALGEAASAALPQHLLTTTTQAALASDAATAITPAVAALTEGVIRNMYLAKLRVFAAVLLTLAVLAVGLWGGSKALLAGPADPPRFPVPPPPPVHAQAKKEVEPKAILKRAAQAANAVEATKDEDLRKKVETLVNIANRQERDGDRDGAAATFQMALEVAPKIKDEVTRADALYSIGFYQAHAGLIKEARKTMESIAIKKKEEAWQAEQHLGRIQSEIAARLARDGDFKEAVKAAESMPVRVRKFKVKDGDKEKEIERRETIYRDDAFKHVAAEQVKAGDPAGAWKTVLAIEDKSTRFYPMREVIVAQGVKDRAAAAKLLEEFRKEYEKTPHWNYWLAATQAAIGDAEGALGWIEKLKSDDETANALLGLSIGLAEREQAGKKKKP